MKRWNHNNSLASCVFISFLTSKTFLSRASRLLRGFSSYKLRNSSLVWLKLWKPSERFEKQTHHTRERPALVPGVLFVFVRVFILQEGSEMTSFFFHLVFHSFCVWSFIHKGGLIHTSPTVCFAFYKHALVMKFQVLGECGHVAHFIIFNVGDHPDLRHITQRLKEFLLFLRVKDHQSSWWRVIFGWRNNPSSCFDTFRSDIPCQDCHGNEARKEQISSLLGTVALGGYFWRFTMAEV